ncbi:hemagglutinin repeat-containing protein [Ralstonia pseudosolanacearum]
MNAKCYRTVFNAVRGMLVAVEKSARSTGKGRQPGGQAGATALASTACAARFTVLPAVFGAWCALSLPYTAQAQVVAAPGSGAQVIQTQNGLQQVNVARPNGSGVSLNTYTQFSVPSQGTILNNAPGITQTQQAGYINGNPNLLPGGSARIIVNQVTSTSPSTLRGYLEVAGPRAEVVIANPNGILVNGGGFVNTSRATLTTGVPVFGGSGSLDAYRVTGGQITVQGAGLNASNVDQVDLIARAVSVNASVYANQLNVVAGANQVDRSTLGATPIAGDGAAPANGIDVSQLGGMYANKILLASTEKGVGVSLRGVAAAQAGDLTLTAQGQLVLAGQTNATGNLSIAGRDGITNTGATYGTGAVSVSTSGALDNGGTLASQQGLTVNAGSLASTGSLGAGVASDGTISQAADLNVTTTGALSATGKNVAGGTASFQGAGVSLANSQTTANANLALTSTGGADLTGAAVHAGGAVNATAAGALINDRGHLSSGGATGITAGSVSNAGGQIVSQGATSLQASGALNNAQGTVQAGGALTVNAASVDNTAGRLVSLNADGLSLNAGTAMTNVGGTTSDGAQGGVIGANGAISLTTGTLTNRAQITAGTDATLTATTLDNANGSVTAGNALTAQVAGAVNNQHGALSAAATTVNAASLDNTAGKLEGNQLGVTTTGDLVNRGGAINQYSQTDTTVKVGGTLDNTNGAITANARNLTIDAQAVTNDGGKLLHSGSGTFTVGSQGALSNVAGQIQTNGALSTQSSTLDNTNGLIASQGTETVTTTDALDNTNGTLHAGDALKVQAGTALTNVGGTIESNSAHGTLAVSAASLDNTSGRVVNVGDGTTRVAVQQTLLNANPAGTAGRGLIGGNGAIDVTAGTLENHATISAKGDASLTAQRFDNSSGSTTAGGALTANVTGALINAHGALSASAATLSAQSIDNTAGKLEGNQLGLTTIGDLVNRGGAINQYSQTDTTLKVGGTLDNTNGAIAANAQNLTIDAQAVTNNGGKLLHSGSGTFTVGSQGALSNVAGQIQTNGALSTQSSTLDNTNGSIASQGTETVTTTDTLDNTNGTLHAGDALTVQAGAALTNVGGNIESNSAHGTLAVSAASLDNTSGRVVNVGDGTTRVTVQQTLLNANPAGTTGRGLIGGNGAIDVTAGMLQNHATISAKGDASLTAQRFDNSSGSTTAGGALTAGVAGALVNQQGVLSGGATSLTAASLDNGSGRIEGSQLEIASTGDLGNRGGTIQQFGQADASIRAGGTLDNTAGSIAVNGKNLTLAGQTMANDGGKVLHAGTGTLSVTAQNALTNTNSGQLQTNGALTAQVGSLDNAHGTVSAQGDASVTTTGDLLNRQGAIYGQTRLTLTSDGQIDNAGGSAQTSGNLSASAAGALSNAGGTLTANGAHGIATVSAAGLDNTAGRLTNAGDGVTTITATRTLNNTGGALGGNGDVTIDTPALTNTGSGQIAAGGVLTLNTSTGIDNRGGAIYGAQGLTLTQSGATLANDGGAVLGGQDVKLSVASMTNTGGAIRANHDIAAQGAMSGSGEVTAGGDLSLRVTGDYLNDAANRLRADGNMEVRASGTLTNSGTLGAAGNTTVRAANVVNTAGGDITGASTTVSADNSLNNAGRIEGNAVQTASVGLLNTGTVIGNTVLVQANDVTNAGASALIAGVKDAKVYATNSVSNLDGATIYSAGNLQIARDGTRDAATGLLANQVGTLTNRSATMDADGDIDIAAHTLNNTRTSIVTAAGTPQTTSRTLTTWYAGFTGAALYSHSSRTVPSWNWDGQSAQISGSLTSALMQPITVTVPKSTVTNLNTTSQTLSFSTAPTEIYINPLEFRQCGREDPQCKQDATHTRNLTANATQWYQSIQDNGTTYSITFWPDWDPNKNIRPDQVRLRFDLGSDSHDYSEISRTVTTTTTTDQLISASDPGRIRASGAIRINSDGGTILNQSSIMAAGGDLIRSAVGGTVKDQGTVLQRSVSTTETSTFYWHQKTGGDSDTQVVPYPTSPVGSTTVTALPAIASSNQTVQTTAQSINVTTVDRLGATVTGSGLAGGGASGQALAGTTGSTAGAGTLTGGTGNTLGSAGALAGGTGTLGGTATGTVGAASGSTHAPQTLGSAQTGIPNLTLPLNGLFHFQPAPSATYLVATDARFTQYTKFISSDYMLGALNLTPQQTQKRLGDGFYEEKLVRDQVTQLTGRTFLAGYTDQLTEYRALMDAGVTYAKAFNLTPGIGLSDAQMQQLTSNMVWLVSQDVTLPDGTHQSVLVPKLYLAQANAVDLNSTGALVTGKAVNLNASGDLANSGRIVGDMATQVVGNSIVNRGTIGGAGSATLVQAVQDVRNTGGGITGQNVVVQAGRDVISETQTISNLQTVGPNGYSVGATGVGSVGSITGTNTVSVLAGRDITLAGATISAGSNAQLAAGRDLNFGTVLLGTTQDAVSRGGQSYFHDQTTTVSGSTVSAGGNVVAVAGRDATLTSSAIQAGGNATVVAGRNVSVAAASDTHTHSEGSLGADAQYKKSSYDETVQGSAIQAGNSATLGAGQGQAVGQVLRVSGIAAATPEAGGTGNVAVLGSSVTTGNGAANLIATGDVTVGAVNEKHTDYAWLDNKHAGFLSSEQTTKERSSQSSTAVGSSISADSVTASAGRDLTVQGSTVAATNDVDLQAGRDLTVTTAQNTSSSHSYEETTKSGLGATGSGISYGTRNQKDTINDNAVTQTSSLVGSTGGNVNLSAGNALKIAGSQVVAAKDITGTGADVTIEAAQGSTHHDETHEVKQSGFTLGVSGGAVGAAIGAAQKLESAGQSKDGRASALWGVAAARDAFDAGKALGGPGGATAGAAVTLSWGSSQSKQTQTDDATQHTGSTVTAGGKASFTATGVDANGNKTAGDLNIVGSDVNAKQAALKAAHDVNIVSATDTDENHSRNESSSVSVGVSYGFGQGQGGFGVSASASKAKGNADGTSATQVNSHVNGSESVSIASGNDTNVQGGVVSGGKVVADVGGNLNLASRQDTSETHAKQESMGGGFSISQGGGSASFSASRGRADGTYANVAEQSGIRAGDGGFDINVKGNTDLKGAVIASTATPDKNQLTTGTLTWSDVKNHSEYSADSMGMSMGGTFGGTNSKPTSGQESGKNTGGISPMIPQSESGSESGVAQSAIAQGGITITNKDAQKQDVSTLNRDTTNTNTTVGKTPDLNDLLSQQADMMAAAQAAGEAVAKTVGDVAGKKEAEAKARLKAANEAYQQDPSEANKAAVAAAEGDVANWKEGGSYRAALHSAGGALIAGLGGGNALAGAAGAGLSSLAAPKLDELARSVASNVGTDNAGLNEAIGNVAANIAAGGLGLAVGGGSGAATAANADRFNRQLHPDEQKWIKDNAKRFAQQQGISEQDAEQRLAQQGFRQVQNGVGGAWDQAASNFLQQAHGMLAPDSSCVACGPGYMFQATAAQKANADMYASFLPQDRRNFFYMQNGLTQPTSEQLASGNARDMAARQQVQNQTIDAAAAAGLVVSAPGLAGAAGATMRFCALNPSACAVASGTGGVISGGADAAGQYFLNNGTIRSGEVAFAALNGAVTAPLGMNLGVLGNIFLGGVGNVANSGVQNLYYGDTNSLGASALLGQMFGGFGARAGGAVQAASGAVFPRYSPGAPAVLQIPSATAPLIGAGAGAIVQGGGSFVPSVSTQPSSR